MLHTVKGGTDRKLHLKILDRMNNFFFWKFIAKTRMKATWLKLQKKWVNKKKKIKTGIFSGK